MDLKNYFHLIRRYLWVIILFTIFATGLTTVIVFLIPPTYKASLTLMVNQASTTETINLNDIMTSERLAKTYAEIITKRTVLSEVDNELNLNLDYEDFLEKVNVELIRDTQLISLSVKDKSPNTAAKIADAIAQKFSEEVITLQGERQSYNTIAIVEKAVPPEKPDSPKKALSIGLAGILSLLTITGIIFL